MPKIPDKLKEYLVQPHPYREIFRQYGFPTTAIANYLGVSSSYCYQLLSKSANISPKHEQKLEELKDALKEGGAI